MAHITVQLGPCCTAPFGSVVPTEPSSMWQPPVRARTRHHAKESGPSSADRSAVRRSGRLRIARSRASAK